MLLYSQQRAIPDQLYPPPIEDVSATYAESLEFHLLFYRFVLEIQTGKMSGFWADVWIFFLEKDFCLKNLEIQDCIISLRLLTECFILVGSSACLVQLLTWFFWNSPMNKWVILIKDTIMPYCLRFHKEKYNHVKRQNASMNMSFFFLLSLFSFFYLDWWKWSQLKRNVVDGFQSKRISSYRLAFVVS